MKVFLIFSRKILRNTKCSKSGYMQLRFSALRQNLFQKVKNTVGGVLLVTLNSL